MTNESISGFLNSIAEAKRAFDAEPEYQRRISELELEKCRLGDTVAQRELRIHDLKQSETELMQKLRSVEAERDDAGFRHLEADDKVQGLLTLVHSVIRDALKAVSAVEGKESIVIDKNHYEALAKDRDAQSFRVADLETQLEHLQTDMLFAQEQLTRPFVPSEDTSSSKDEGTDPWSPKPEPYELPRSVPEFQQGQREAVPTTSVSVPTLQASGQSETDPTTAPTPSSASVQEVSDASSAERGLIEGQTDHTSQVSAFSTSAKSETSAASSASPPERNRDRSTFYKGRKYYDVTYYVPLHLWLDGGGTKEDYDWRPLPDVSRASHSSS